MTFALVTTTIHVPTFLADYLEDARAHGHRDVVVIVAGDRKTPAEAIPFCAEVQRRFGYEVVMLDVPAQERYLDAYPELAAYLPWNSIQRRNVALLYAYERGADVVVTLDDDNLLAEPNYLAHHAAVGTEVEMDGRRSAAGWINVCDVLEEAHGFRFYHRGFPADARATTAAAPVEPTRARGRVVVNAGFWLGEPDIDAVTRLAVPLEVTGYRARASFALAPGTWSPFNSQNTALSRAALPAYFLSPDVGRYDDIWAGYVTLAIAQARGDLVVYGRPLVRQLRNPHDLWVDLDREREAMRLTDRFCGYLRAVAPRADDYGTAYRAVAMDLRRAIAADAGLDDAARRYLDRYVTGMDVWAATMRRMR